MSDAEVLEAVRRAFSGCPRPEHFTNYTHCEECGEHDDLLLSRDVDSLQIEDVGNPGWDPICFVSPEGFAYLFPGLARLALNEPSPTHGWYGDQLLFHLTYKGQENRHLAHFTPQQRGAVVSFLRHLADTRAELADQYLCADTLLWAIDLWSAYG